ncbi:MULTISPECIES: IS1595 family transposase [Bacteria]|uniref:IS1595 family transposase n=3 Tax=Bacillati TaxID=1783272 RepID=A0A3S2TSI9_9BACI|nr:MULTISPECIES: IS1595 family transposase [Niallia]MDK8643943.1 IS1595 family transposase [Niallia taxi]MED4040516.1 IS1595 family transposase [Niallia taxi]MED4057552.1 IS1595 family transposase [Niallia taxi]MED4122363.1 IS1595 family transposase [Niallia taxi]RVT59474.1 IS1595 family transposase [Niallia taxi]
MMKDIYAHFSDLTKDEQIQLFNLLKEDFIDNNDADMKDAFTIIRETRFKEGLGCIHCGSVKVKRNGKYRDRQRYLCRDCGKSFNDLSNTPISGTRYLGKWAKYFQMMVEGYTLPKIAKRLKIHISTAFYWRHKILFALRSIGYQMLKGIIESDETFFKESLKGRRTLDREPKKRGGRDKKRGISNLKIAVVVAQDRSGQVIAQKAGTGRVRAEEIDAVIGSYIDPSSLLCTDTATNYKKFALIKSLKHEPINLSKEGYVKKGIYHLQNVNNYHKRLKGWMDRFQGVATKYLDNYLYWFSFLQQSKKLAEKEQINQMLLSSCQNSNNITVNFLREI